MLLLLVVVGEKQSIVRSRPGSYCGGCGGAMSEMRCDAPVRPAATNDVCCVDVETVMGSLGRAGQSFNVQDGEADSQTRQTHRLLGS